VVDRPGAGGRPVRRGGGTHEAGKPVNAGRLVGLAGVPLAFAAGSVVMHVWLARAPRSIANDLAQPLAVVTAWHAYGSVAFAILAVTVAAAAAGLVAAVRRSAPSAQPGDGITVVGLAALALGAAGTWPVVFSSDVYAYAAYGALALTGVDPYAPVPASLHGPFIEAARYQWTGPFPPCIYGPLFVALAREGVALLAPAGVAATLTGFRLAAGAAFLAGIALLDAALAGRSPRLRFAAVCAYGLNPVALWTAAEGHNDAFLMLAVLAGAALAARGQRVVGALLLALSPLLKAPGLLLAAMAALHAAFFEPRGRRATLAALGLGTLLAAALAVPPLRPALAALGAHGRYAPSVSAQGLLGPVAALVLAAAAALFAVICLKRQRRAGFGWAGIAVLLALPNPYPWYAPWLLPLALAAGAEPAGIALWAATISSVVRYLPDAAGDLLPGAARLSAMVAATPLLWALVSVPASARKKVVAQP